MRQEEPRPEAAIGSNRRPHHRHRRRLAASCHFFHNTIVEEQRGQHLNKQHVARVSGYKLGNFSNTLDWNRQKVVITHDPCRMA